MIIIGNELSPGQPESGKSKSYDLNDAMNFGLSTEDCCDAKTGGKFHITSTYRNFVVIPGGSVISETAGSDNPGKSLSANRKAEIIMIDLKSVSSINQIRLHTLPGEDYRNFLSIDMAVNKNNWSRILTDKSGPSSNHGRVSICFPTVNARYIRITSNENLINWLEYDEAVEVWGYPVPDIKWIYHSKAALLDDLTMVSSEPNPRDPVLFSSGASGVQYHTIENGWLYIDSGITGNGRVYWDYHQLPEFESLPYAGFNIAMTGTFKLTPEIDNLSIKDGNHGTNGWDLEETLAFGGFGLAIGRDGVSSKAEYWHNEQGVGYRIDYPEGFELEDYKEYKYFVTIRSYRQAEEVRLNLWLDFGSHGWVNVMENRTWGREGWSPGMVPDRDDKEDILRGPSYIRRHHIWTRANNRENERGVLPIKDVRIGVISPFKELNIQNQ